MATQESVEVDGTDETQDVDADGSLNQGGEYKHPDPYFAEHLNGLFPTLQFPPELARRILTHGSHPAATYGHNAAYSFMGTFRSPYFVITYRLSFVLSRP
jgi:hypothetical protein